MEKRIVIKFNAKELTEILGIQIVMDFNIYKNLTDNLEYEDLDVEEKLLKDVVLATRKNLFDNGFSNCYSRIYAKGLAPEFRSNQELIGKLTFIYPDEALL